MKKKEKSSRVPNFLGPQTLPSNSDEEEDEASPPSLLLWLMRLGLRREESILPPPPAVALLDFSTPPCSTPGGLSFSQGYL